MMTDHRRFPSILSYCFRCHSSSDDAQPKPAYKCLARSSSWLRKGALQLPALKDKCRSLFRKIGKRGIGETCLCRGGRHAGEFRYDPLSYSLNFENESSPNQQRRQPHDFSARFVLAPVAAGKNGQALNSPALPTASAMDRG